MKTKPEGWNIVLAGFWNRAIFTPEWVGKWLFQQSEVETFDFGHAVPADRLPEPAGGD